MGPAADVDVDKEGIEKEMAKDKDATSTAKSRAGSGKTKNIGGLSEEILGSAIDEAIDVASPISGKTPTGLAMAEAGSASKNPDLGPTAYPGVLGNSFSPTPAFGLFEPTGPAMAEAVSASNNKKTDLGYSGVLGNGSCSSAPASSLFEPAYLTAQTGHPNPHLFYSNKAMFTGVAGGNMALPMQHVTGQFSGGSPAQGSPDLIPLLFQVVHELSATREMMTRMMGSMEQTVKNLVGTISDLKTDNAALKVEIENMKSQRAAEYYDGDNDENGSLRDVVQRLNQRFDEIKEDQDKQHRALNIRVAGLQEKEDENVKDEVAKILAQHMGIQQGGIMEAFRVGKPTGKDRNIVVRFIDRGHKMAVLQKRAEL